MVSIVEKERRCEAIHHDRGRFSGVDRSGSFASPLRRLGGHSRRVRYSGLVECIRAFRGRRTGANGLARGASMSRPKLSLHPGASRAAQARYSLGVRQR
jgi:hypothetical protein